MTDIKYKILEKFYHAENRAIKENDLLRDFLGQTIAAQYALKELRENSLLKRDYTLDALVLTPVGAMVFEDVREERRKNAIERGIAIAAIVVALIPSIVDFIRLIIELTYR